MMSLGIMGTLQLDHLAEGSAKPIGGIFLIHRWSHNYCRPIIINHESQEYTDDPISEVPEILEVLGPADARRARSLKVGQQAVLKTGAGLREVVQLIHRAA